MDTDLQVGFRSPIHAADGQVVGYQRHLAPSDLAGLDMNTRLDEMLGSWRGRILEEQISDAFRTFAHSKAEVARNPRQFVLSPTLYRTFTHALSYFHPHRI